MFLTILLLILPTSSALALVPGLCTPQGALSHVIAMTDAAAVTKDDTRDLSEFLRYLISVSPKTAPAFKAVRFDPDRLLSFISANGLLVKGPNESEPIVRVSRSVLKDEITARRGISFTYLALLAYEVSGLDPNATHPERHANASCTLTVTEHYILSFAREGTRLRLTTIENISPEGD